MYEVLVFFYIIRKLSFCLGMIRTLTTAQVGLMFLIQAPAVVFIDELDAVGRQRGLIGGSGGQERDSTLNQVCKSLNFF